MPLPRSSTAPLTADAAGVLDRLRQRLGSSAEAPRPVAKMDLPLGLGHLITARAVARLKPAAVLVPILRRAGGDTVLLTRRAAHLRNHRGQISFPGGRRDEADASYTATALREAHEEVGLPPAAVQVLGYLDDQPTLTGYRITPVVGVIEADYEPTIDPGEVAETFELPIDWVFGPDRFERKALTRDGFRVPFLELRYEGREIWGATAAILWNLRSQGLD